MLFGLVVFGGVGFLVGAALGAALGTRGQWLALVLLVAPVAALVYFALGVSAATTDPRECRECVQTFGHYTDPLFGFVLITNVIGWWLGALLGAGGRALYRRSASTRPSAA